MTDGLDSARGRPAPRDDECHAAALKGLRRQLIGFAVALVWNREDAEELVQEAFKIAAGKKLSPRDRAFGPWMFRTTSNLCLNHRRRRRPEPLCEWMDARDTRSPEESFDQRERLERLREAVAALPPQQRIAVTLRWIERREYAEIADIMSLTESAVRAHVHQARRKLMSSLGDDGHA